MPRHKWRCALCDQGAPDVARSAKKRALCDVCYDGLAPRGLAWCTGRRLRSPHRVKVDQMAPGRAWCQECQRVYVRTHIDHVGRSRAWRERNPERVKEYLQRPDVRARRQAWRAANAHSIRAQRRDYYLRHRDKEIANARTYRTAHPGYVAAASRRRYQRRKLRMLQSWRKA